MDGIFVDPSSPLDGSGSGTAKKPFKMLAQALAYAFAQGGGRINLAAGTYGAVSIEGQTLSQKVIFEGGWDGATWTRTCDASLPGKTVLQSGGAYALRVASSKGIFELNHLTVKTLPQSDAGHDTPGTTTSAVIARGEGLFLSFSDVQLIAGKGGRGGPGSAGDMGALLACNGVTDCATGTDGAPAENGMPAPLGSFGDEGYVPASGQVGPTGSSGLPGTAGEPGETVTGCWGSCSGQPKDGGCVGNGGQGTVTVPAGTCGCPSAGGQGGKPGQGGGGSIALSVSGATVTLRSSRLQAGEGGDGGLGGEGGDSEPGAQGKASAGDCCHQGGCYHTNEFSCYYADTKDNNSACGLPVSGKAAGGPGGHGGKGGRGGGGSGGPSISALLMGGGTIDADATVTFEALGGGSGADGALPGVTKANIYTP